MTQRGDTPLVQAAGRVAARGFALGSALRGAKFFHPVGVVHEATVDVDEVLAEPGRYHSLIRFSRGVGLPVGVPDVLGMAVRLLDAHGEGRHQDFLMVTSGDGAFVQHFLLPARRFSALPLSTVLPYRAGGGSFIVGARALDWPGEAAGDEMTDLLRIAGTGLPAFELGVAALGRRLRPVGEITLGERLEPSANRIRFDPWNTGGGLEPATALNAIRAYVYPASQRAWH